jgi:AmiR/NasT family two-component response regulator
MKQPLRVAVADDEPIMQMYLEETVSDFGHTVVSAAGDGLELLEHCRELLPDLVITDIKMPRLDGFLAMREICRECPLPVVFITGYDERERALQAERECVLVYLMKPVGEADLRLAIDLVMQRYEQFQAIHEEEPDLRKALCNRVHVENAKALLAKRLGLDDGEAFQYLCERARENGQSLLCAAMDVLTATQA